MSAGDFNNQWAITPEFWDSCFAEPTRESFRWQQERRREPFSWADAEAVIRVNVSDWHAIEPGQWSQLDASISANPEWRVLEPGEEVTFSRLREPPKSPEPLEDLTGDNREEL